MVRAIFGTNHPRNFWKFCPRFARVTSKFSKIHSANLSQITLPNMWLMVQTLSEKTCNTIVNVLYRPPNWRSELFQKFWTTFLLNTKNSNKNIHIEGYFNLNLLDYDINKNVRSYLNLIYQNSFILTNKPTRVIKKISTIKLFCR